MNEIVMVIRIGFFYTLMLTDDQQLKTLDTRLNRVDLYDDFFVMVD